CAALSCWLTHLLDQWLGQKKTIFVSCFISFVTRIWSAVTNSWWHYFISRFFLGFGVSAEPATFPIYA
ncbi:hypothetical protein EDC04DRAFT_2512389, partial [Pisolithus marmoratus]